jgi:hypothetical protein
MIRGDRHFFEEFDSWPVSEETTRVAIRQIHRIEHERFALP